MLKENQTALQKYLDERTANQFSPKTNKHDACVMRQLDTFLAKPFIEASKEDLVPFFAGMLGRHTVSTIHLYKIRVKHFYAWLFECDYREYPACVKWIRSTNPGRGTKTKGLTTSLDPEDLLTDEDVLKLINARDHPRDQAMIAVLYETGAEALELLNMKVKSVRFDEHGAVATLKGEQGRRRIRIVDSVPYIQAWLNVHPLRKESEASLWWTLNSGAEGMGYDNLHRVLKTAKRDSGVKKPVSPRLLRHACLTKMAGVLPEQKLKVFAGWNPASKMAAVYVHLSGKDLDDDILELHGKAVIKEKEPLKGAMAPRECPRCRHENPATALFCFMCGQQLDVTLDESKELEKELWWKSLMEVTMDLREKKPELRPEISKFEHTIFTLAEKRLQAKKKGEKA